MAQQKFRRTVDAWLLLAGFFVILVLGYFKAHAPVPAPGDAVRAAVIVAPAPVRSSWLVETLDDPYGSITATIAMNIADADNSLVVRRAGNKLQCYVNTGQVLLPDTHGSNEDAEDATVQYRFDSGKEISRQWALSADKHGLLCPDNPAPFLSEMAKAKSFVFGFKSSDGTTHTVTYDVSGLPAELQ